jgi:hypothetical protein
VVPLGGVEEDQAAANGRPQDAGRRAEIAPATGSAALMWKRCRAGCPRLAHGGGTPMSGPSSRGADPDLMVIGPAYKVRPFLARGGRFPTRSS